MHNPLYGFFFPLNLDTKEPTNEQVDSYIASIGYVFGKEHGVTSDQVNTTEKLIKTKNDLMLIAHEYLGANDLPNVVFDLEKTLVATLKYATPQQKKQIEKQGLIPFIKKSQITSKEINDIFSNDFTNPLNLSEFHELCKSIEVVFGDTVNFDEIFKYLEDHSISKVPLNIVESVVHQTHEYSATCIKALLSQRPDDLSPLDLKDMSDLVVLDRYVNFAKRKGWSFKRDGKTLKGQSLLAFCAKQVGWDEKQPLGKFLGNSLVLTIRKSRDTPPSVLDWSKASRDLGSQGASESTWNHSD